MRMLCIITFFLVPVGSSAQLDLHAHLFMKHGLGPLLDGSFKDRERETSPESRRKTKASIQSLLAIGSPEIIVVSLYSHPFVSHPFHFDLKKNVRDGLEDEYQELNQFVRLHSDRFAIARNPKEARIILSAKKTVFILSIEGAYGSLETEADYKKWIDERGVAIVTPFHLTEDQFGGVALMSNRFAIFNTPLTFLTGILLTGGSCLRDFCRSTIGMKPEGRFLIESLLKRKVWIDLAHANEMEIREILPDLKARSLPLLVTHTELREVFPAERGVGNLEVSYLMQQGGIIGMLPTDDMIFRSLDPKVKPVCESGVVLFKEIFQFAQKSLGELHVALGSDVNAPLLGLAPDCRSPVSNNQSELEKNGFYSYSQWSALHDYLSDDPTFGTRIMDAFLDEWARVRPEKSRIESLKL